jgi:hypothetical protein
MCLIIKFVLAVYPKQNEEEFVEELMRGKLHKFMLAESFH